ncbi:hypothetical protein Tco_1359389 [Tanacetum coccineum]
MLGVHEEQYAILRDYAIELKERNKDTSVKIQVETNTNLAEFRVFKRIYVCLDPLKAGYRLEEIMGCIQLLMQLLKLSPRVHGTKFDCDSEDMEEEAEYMTDDEVVMSEQEECNHGVENMKDALISIIKSIRQEMKDDIMKRQFEASTTSASDEVSSIASNEVDNADDNTSNTAPCRLPKELSPKSFLLPFSINNHNLYATTLVAKGSLRMWICFRDHERQTVKGSYMGFADFLQVPYGQQNIDNTTWERRMDEIKIGHNNLHESDREFILNKWILDSYDVEEEYAREIGDPYSRRFDEYNRVFNNEIEHLSNEYILRIGKKGYVLDDVWEKCQQNYKKTNEAWHDEAYEENEMWRIGDEKTDYDPPYDEALPLGRMNGARFKAMIRQELEGNNYVHEGIKSLREDGDKLKDFVLSCGCLCLLYGVALHWIDFQELLLSMINIVAKL